MFCGKREEVFERSEFFLTPQKMLFSWKSDNAECLLSLVLFLLGTQKK